VSEGERHATESAVNPTGVSDKRAFASQLLPGGFPERILHILRQVHLLPIVNVCYLTGKPRNSEEENCTDQKIYNTYYSYMGLEKH